MNWETQRRKTMKKTVIVRAHGRESGIYWSCGYKLVIDHGVIIDIFDENSWTPNDLRRNALQMDHIPTLCERAPNGWEEWRSNKMI